MSKYMFVVTIILVLFSLLFFTTRVALGQTSCAPYQVYDSSGVCYSSAVLVGFVSTVGPVRTEISISNTTNESLWYRFDYNRSNGHPGKLLSRSLEGGEGLASFELIRIASGRSKTISLSVADGEESSTWFWIRAYVFAPTPDILDQQRDTAIKSTVAYSPPDIAGGALPWSFFGTATKEVSLRVGTMGSITETLRSTTVTATDRHNMFLLVNPNRTAQAVKITISDNSGNVLNTHITRELGREELLVERLQDIFGNSMFPEGVGDQIRVKFEGLEGGAIFVQNLELLGGYAVSTTPTWIMEGPVQK